MPWQGGGTSVEDVVECFYLRCLHSGEVTSRQRYLFGVQGVNEQQSASCIWCQKKLFLSVSVSWVEKTNKQMSYIEKLINVKNCPLYRDYDPFSVWYNIWFLLWNEVYSRWEGVCVYFLLLFFLPFLILLLLSSLSPSPFFSLLLSCFSLFLYVLRWQNRKFVLHVS